MRRRGREPVARLPTPPHRCCTRRRLGAGRPSRAHAALWPPHVRERGRPTRPRDLVDKAPSSCRAVPVGSTPRTRMRPDAPTTPGGDAALGTRACACAHALSAHGGNTFVQAAARHFQAVLYRPIKARRGLRRNRVRDNALCRRVGTSWPHLKPISRLTIMDITESGGLSGAHLDRLHIAWVRCSAKGRGKMY